MSPTRLLAPVTIVAAAAAALFAARLPAGAPLAAAAPAPATRPAAESVESQAARILALIVDASDEDLLRTRAAIARASQAIVENIANAESTAYKAVTPRIADAGREVGLRRDMSQGSLESTNRPLDIAIEGDGFFRVMAEGKLAYTRNGNLFVNNEGALVVGADDGYRLQPEILVPADARGILIGSTGLIEFERPGVVGRTTAGQLRLVRFPEPSALKQMRGSVFVATDAAGEPIEDAPGHDGAGRILQAFLEGSNVDPAREELRLARLSEWQRMVENALRASASPAR